LEKKYRQKILFESLNLRVILRTIISNGEYCLEKTGGERAKGSPRCYDARDSTGCFDAFAGG
jgi:hypothetical protein